ncbi:MAG: ABC-2 family transporter protein [Bdellovibrionales bacterium]|nr:ABC-2 family transporter protein [Bdellovibrionales bacterium]
MTALPTWAWRVADLEVRRLFSYRVDFWVSFVVSTGVQLLASYFLWLAVFEHTGRDTVGGYSFQALVYYSMMAPLFTRAVRGKEFGLISDEIYDGSLSRFLLYPIPMFGYKLTLHAAHVGMTSLQLLLGFAAYALTAGLPAGHTTSAGSIALGLSALLAASVLHFFLSLILEMVAFWAEGIWSLLVMLRFVTSFLGGGHIPLTLFPEQMQQAMAWLPFPYLVSFPLLCFQGEMGLADWAIGVGAIAAWSLIFGLIALRVWRKGTLQFTGVGM